MGTAQDLIHFMRYRLRKGCRNGLQQSGCDLGIDDRIEWVFSFVNLLVLNVLEPPTFVAIYVKAFEHPHLDLPVFCGAFHVRFGTIALRDCR